jgi:two-component system phosphate regulon sensor histidine kinase PhoR
LKNITPKQVAILVALFTAMAVAGLAYCWDIPQSKVLWLGFASGVLVMVMVYYAINYFIYRKIKLIYKTIRSTKTLAGQDDFYPMSEDPIGQVYDEVQQWSKDQTSKKEEADQLEKYRKEFLGNVSHELKTPIFNIQGYIHTLLDGAMDDPETNLNFLKKAARSADRMEALVKDLLTISELESGSVKMDWENFDLQELLQDVFDSVDHKARQRAIQIQVKAGCRAPFMVRADRKKIRQVLVNLLSNSIHYGIDHGLTQVGVYDMDRQFLVEISDNGLGIEAEHLPRLFERFYRVDKGRSRSEGGTGLGLAIVKHMLEVHGHTIHVRSSAGVGSTFGFTLDKPSI